MEIERACAAEKNTLRLRFKKNIAYIKYTAYMTGHKYFWKTLHAFGLARTYSVIMCNANLYRTFTDGRCQWCGNNHKPTNTLEDE